MIKRVNFSDFDLNKLAEISINPETQADDFFDYSKVVVKKPWGYEYLIYQNEVVAVWILYIKSGFHTSMHCHPNKKTSLVVLAGEAICSTLNEEIPRTAGEGLLIEKATFHSTKSISEEGIFVMEIETPINKRDLIRLEDSYGRVGKGYETINQMSFNLQNYNYISLIESDVYYNVKKKFGQCSISLAKFTDGRSLNDKFKLEKWDAIGILKGKIFDERGKIVAEVGDTIDFEHFIQYDQFYSNGEIEIIIIKKKDSMVKLSDFVSSFLEQQGIEKVFLVPGSANVHLLDSIGKNNNIQHICTQTEEAATTAAESCAKLNNKLAVAIVASGACTTGSLTGVADAWIDSTPLLVISGQSPSDQTRNKSTLRQLGVQEINIIDIVKPITKYAVMITDATKIKYHLQKAIYLAKTGRPGPVWLDIPIDIQGMNINEEELVSFDLMEKELEELNSVQKVKLDNDLKQQILKLFNLLKNAQRPVILAGNGIRLASAEKDFLNLIDLFSIPVLTSKRGADLLPANNLLFYGRPGAYGQRSANFIIQNSDLLIGIGSRLSIPLIGRNYKAFARAAKKVVVDIDTEELNKSTFKPDLAINCCAKEFINGVLEMKSDYVQPKILDWLAKCAFWKEKYSTEKIQFKENSVNAYFFMETLSQELKEGAIITIDAGSPIIFAMQQFKFKLKQRLISATGLENPSFALPASIGACVGSNGQEVICICDDRGFQKNIQELETIINYKLPIKIFILNSKGYSYVRKTQEAYFGGRYVASDSEAGSITPDIIKIGNAYEIPAFTIFNHQELETVLKKTLNISGPAICNLNIDRDQQIVPRIVFTVKQNGKWLAKPLEDMYPFLDRKEFKENMVVEISEGDLSDG